MTSWKRILKEIAMVWAFGSTVLSMIAVAIYAMIRAAEYLSVHPGQAQILVMVLAAILAPLIAGMVILSGLSPRP